MFLWDSGALVRGTVFLENGGRRNHRLGGWEDRLSCHFHCLTLEGGTHSLHGGSGLSPAPWGISLISHSLVPSLWGMHSASTCILRPAPA